MPYELEYLVKGRLTLCKAFGTVSDEDLDHWEAEVEELLNEVDGLFLHAIYDMSEMSGLPSLQRVTRVKVGAHPKAGWVMFIGVPNKSFVFILSIVAQLSQARTRFLPDIAEALALIHEIDPKTTVCTTEQVERTITAMRIRQQSQTPT